MPTHRPALSLLFLALTTVPAPVARAEDAGFVETEPPPHLPVAPEVKAGPVRTLVDAARRDTDRGHARLAELCDRIGHRLAGSPSLDRAVAWAKAGFEADRQEAVRLDPVQVPVWIRGQERLRMLAPLERELDLLGLGGSVGTDGIEAPVAVVGSFEELGPQVKGRIVVFDVAMKPDLPAIKQYATAVEPRANGASLAASHGAVAALVRSVTARSLYTPHTGALRYDPEHPQIPAAAITTEDAAWIRRLVEGGQDVRLRLEMGARTGPDATSHNVLAEVRGGQAPEEIVLIGAHLDSWDVGQGAHDDGAGVVEVMEALRQIRSLVETTGRRPRRTIRAVLFTNEENGLRGGRTYAEQHGQERHVAAIETDLGGGWPIAWSASGGAEELAWLKKAAAPLGMPVGEGGGGADIYPLMHRGVLGISLLPDDSRYFDIHHTRADTLDKVDPRQLAEATGALAALAWQLADAP